MVGLPCWCQEERTVHRHPSTLRVHTDALELGSADHMWSIVKVGWWVWFLYGGVILFVKESIGARFGADAGGEQYQGRLRGFIHEVEAQYVIHFQCLQLQDNVGQIATTFTIRDVLGVCLPHLASTHVEVIFADPPLRARVSTCTYSCWLYFSSCLVDLSYSFPTITVHLSSLWLPRIYACKETS